MKKFLAMLLAVAMVFALCACGGAAKPAAEPAVEPAAEAAAPETDAAEAAPAISFPERDVTIICPFGAGGGTDALGRVVAEEATKITGHNFLVENKTGGSGAVGMGEGAAAAPDGYTVSMITVEVNLLPLAGLASFQPSDLKPVLLFNYDADAIFVPAASKYQTLEDLVNAAKAAPGMTNLMVSGFPSHLWLAGAMLNEQSGAEFNLVQESGGAAEQITALLGGHVDATIITAAEGKPYVESGDFRCLAVCNEGDIEGVPTFADCGYDIVVGTWRGFAVPKDTPQEIVDYLEGLFYDISQGEAMKSFLETMSFGEMTLKSADFEALIAQEYEQFKPVIESFS